jgi:uncharacterized protein YggE
MTRIRPLLAAATLIAIGTGPLLAQTPATDAPPPRHGHHAAQPPVRQHHGPVARLTVEGEGQSSAQPDLATISLGVSSRAATAAEAMAQNAEQQTKVVETLKAEGIETRDIQTSGLNLSPVIDYQDGQPPRLTGYATQNMVTVRVRDIAALGGILDKLVASGANEISGITFSREDAAQALDQARSAAIADARHRAEVMAEAAGMKLGPLLSLSEAQSGGGPRPMMLAAEAKRADTPIEAGELTVTAEVTAVFAMHADGPESDPSDGPDNGPGPDAPPAPDAPAGDGDAAN